MKLAPVNVSNQEGFIDLSNQARLTFYDLYVNTNDYGIVEVSRKLSYLDIKEESIKELVDKGFLIRLYQDKNFYAFTYWNLDNGDVKYRKGNSYSEVLGKKKDGTYFLKNNIPSEHIGKPKVFSENKINYLYGDTDNEDYKTEFD